jgi:hypothetical protein
MRCLLFATLGQMSGESRTKHYVGLPPELTNDEDLRTEMPIARTLIIMKDDASGIFLYRFAADGAVVGDTWHESVEEAQGKADFEYGAAVGAWQRLSDDIGEDNIDDFVRSLALDPQQE